MKPDPRLNARLVKAARHNSWIDHAFRRILIRPEELDQEIVEAP